MGHLPLSSRLMFLTLSKGGVRLSVPCGWLLLPPSYPNRSKGLPLPNGEAQHLLS